MADVATKFPGGGGALWGTKFPPVSGVGATYPPHWGAPGTDFATTASRLYFLPYYFYPVQYTGLKMRNTNTGDNAEVLRLGAYTRSTTTGLPSSLIIDAGEITLSGAAADRTLANAFTPAAEGWGFLAYHANTAATIRSYVSRNVISAVGVVQGLSIEGVFGVASGSYQSNTAGFGAYYVDTTYGALASTAVSPTNITDTGPYMGPYRT